MILAISSSDIDSDKNIFHFERTPNKKTLKIIVHSCKIYLTNLEADLNLSCYAEKFIAVLPNDSRMATQFIFAPKSIEIAELHQTIEI